MLGIDNPKGTGLSFLAIAYWYPDLPGSSGADKVSRTATAYEGRTLAVAVFFSAKEVSNALSLCEVPARLWRAAE